jgi:hypothetical protein
MTIVYRTTQGYPLSYSQLDGNFSDLNTRTQAGWNDLVQEVTVNAGAPNALYAYEFASDATNEVFANFHIRHDYTATGGDEGYPGMVYPHVHWSVNTTNTGVVRWGVEYTLARRADSTGTITFGATSTLYIEVNLASNSQYKHIVSEVATGAGIANGGILETDALILTRFFRDATHPNDTFPDPVFLLTVDIHYPCDHNQTPSRFPPFT